MIHIRRSIITIAAVAAILVFTACATDADSNAESAPVTETTERETTTTTPPTAEEAFLAAADRRLTFGEPGGLEAVLSLGQAACDALDTANDIYIDDAPSDRPETDAQLVELGRDIALGGMFQELDAAVATMVLDMTGEYLCPEHAATIQDWLRTNGYGGDYDDAS